MESADDTKGQELMATMQRLAADDSSAPGKSIPEQIRLDLDAILAYARLLENVSDPGIRQEYAEAIRKRANNSRTLADQLDPMPGSADTDKAT